MKEYVSPINMNIIMKRRVSPIIMNCLQQCVLSIIMNLHSSSKTDLQAVNYVVNASVQSSIQVLYMGHSCL